jgi:sulfatase modifying factor 1
MNALAAFFLPILCLAQEAPRRYALVVGNSSYSGLPALPGAVAEARRMNSVLQNAGFSVMLVENATMPELLARDEAGFLRTVHPGDVVFFYYSGYAVQGEDEDDYLLPVNFDPASDVKDGTFRLTRLLQDLAAKKIGLKMVMLEGPRRLEAPVKGATGLGLVAPDTREIGETLFAMAAQPGQVVAPSADSQGSLFTQAVAEQLGKPGSSPAEAFELARQDVIRRTGQRQIPFVNSVIVTEGFYFHPPVVKPPPPEVSPTVIVQRVDTVPTNPRDREEYVFILPGKFKMGCVPADTRCEANEKPQHEVTIGKGFWLGRTEVEVSSFQRFAEGNKLKMPRAPTYNSGWKTTNYPMVLVAWDQARAFCAWTGGRLPTEAEWEYAARGGVADEVYPLNDENSRDKANFYGKRGNDRFEEAAPVRSFDANPFNLFDMAGNVWEWAEDWFSPAYYAESPASDPHGPATGKEHVVRGGSFESDPKQHLRLSFRRSQGGAAYHVGFRCVLDDNEATKKLLNVR